MLKKLRIKFVCINMITATAMLCIIFTLVILFNAVSLENQSIQLMQSIADSGFHPALPGSPATQVRFPYFTVTISYSGKLVKVTGEFFDLSDEEQILQMVQLALASGEKTGILKDQALRFQLDSTILGYQLIFIDISSEQAAMRNLIGSCLLIGVVSFVLFLLTSLALASWAVKPVDRAWQQQRQFVADASHELKTPLTVIMTNAELLQNPQYDQTERAQLSSSILTMSRQMRGLVESLLELARVDNGAVKTAFAQLDWSELVNDGLLPFEPLYFEKELQLNARIEPGIQIKGSAPHLGQVLEILLDNAMKYAWPNSTVWVTLHKQGSYGLLTVANPGPPIADEDLENIFKRFYRVDKARSRDGSYGLGLSIAQAIVAEHRGRIWAESRDGFNIFTVQINTI